MKTKTLKQIASQCTAITIAVIFNPRLSDDQKKARLRALKPIKQRYQRNAYRWLRARNLDPLTSPIPASIYTK